MERPNYRTGNLLNLLGSVLEGLDGETAGYAPLAPLPPDEVREYRQVVLIVVDGMGWEFLNRSRGRSCLRDLARTRLGSVFPSTTATAVTSFLTGVAPQQHGLTGWHMYFRELGAVLAVLPGVPRYGGCPLGKAGLNAREFFGHRPLFDRLPVPSTVLAPSRIAYSDFNRAHQGKADLLAFETLDDFFARIGQRLRTDRRRRFIYAYWADFDRTAHETGIHSSETERHFRTFDDEFARFLASIRGTGTLVIVTADHGFIDSDAEHTIDLADHPDLADCLALPLCGERRVAYCYLKPGKKNFFESYVRSELDAAMELRESYQLIEEGWFGLGPPHPRLAERVGDYTLVMKENYCLKDWLPFEHRYEQIGVHGGVSASEMGIPLIVAIA